MRKHKTAWWY